jgi:hypothetical protein
MARDHHHDPRDEEVPDVRGEDGARNWVVQLGGNSRREGCAQQDDRWIRGEPSDDIDGPALQWSLMTAP